MPRHVGLLALAAAVAAFAAPGARALGEEAAVQPAAPSLALELEGACPDGPALRALLATLLSPDQARAAPVFIRDNGASYRVAVRDKAITLDDPARDCGARARHAAAYVADELRAHPQVFGPPQWTIEKGLVYEFAPGMSGDSSSWGAEFRGAYGPGAWSLVGCAGARGPVTMTFANGWKAELLRVPLDVGARYTIYRWKLRPWFDLGPSLTVNGILGENLVNTDRQWRVGLGGLAMAGATLPVWKLIGLAAAIAVRWEPRSYNLDVDPEGRVGETPKWWLGLSLNYTIDGKPSSPP
jgi:hypothetical protein